MSAAEWFYARNGQQNGPVTLEFIHDLLRHRQIGPADLVWREGMADWKPAHAVPELAPALSTTDQTLPPPAPPPSFGAAPKPQYGAKPEASPPPAQPVQGIYGAQPTQPPLPYGQAPVKSGLATASLVLGILALVCNGWIFGIIAIILSILAQNEMRQSGNFHSKGTATAGLVLGIVGVAKSVAFVPLFFHHHHHGFFF